LQERQAFLYNPVVHVLFEVHGRLHAVVVGTTASTATATDAAIPTRGFCGSFHGCCSSAAVSIVDGTTT
jgi:hypothetical protein